MGQGTGEGEDVNSDVWVKLLTPPIGAGVFGLAGLYYGAPVASGGLVLGWVAGHLALRGMYAEGSRNVKKYEAAAANRMPTTYILPEHPDGFIPRVSSTIPQGYWQAVGRMVIELHSENLTQDVIELALPSLTQKEIRKLHKRMIGLLKPPVGVVLPKNNHNEITSPVGWVFFLGVAAGKLSPLHRYNLPYYLPELEAPKSMGFREHTRTTRANMQGGEVV